MYSTQICLQTIDLSYLALEKIHKIYKQGEIIPKKTNRYLFLGDLHGNIKAAITLAIRLQVLFDLPLKAIFQVGDFGFWPGGIIAKNKDPYYKEEDAFDFFELKQSTNPHSVFSAGEAELENLHAPFYFIRGNHEDLVSLELIANNQITELIQGIYFVPDYFIGLVSGLNVLAIGGILTDLERGKGKKAKDNFKKAQQKLSQDKRCSNASLLIQFDPVKVDFLLTHSGLASRENRDGSKQLETYLLHSNIGLHFHGHHHRFSMGNVGTHTLSIGLRNLDIDARNMLRPGGFALVAWTNKNNFEVYSDFAS